MTAFGDIPTGLLEAARPANVLPINQETQKAAARTLREIATSLNARGIATAPKPMAREVSVSRSFERRSIVSCIDGTVLGRTSLKPRLTKCVQNDVSPFQVSRVKNFRHVAKSKVRLQFQKPLHRFTCLT